MPKKPAIKRAIVYMPERLYYRLAGKLKPVSVSAFFRQCAKTLLAK